MTRLVLAEDHVVMRQALRHLLDAQQELTVVGETDNGADVAALALATRADIVLLDLGLPRLHGLDAIADVRAQAPACRILVLSMHGTEEYTRTALARGAAGYVLKGADTSELLAALRTVGQGRRHVAPTLAHCLSTLEATSRVDDAPAALTPRERDVFRWVAEGHGNKSIAARLGISPRTVESHRANLMRKVHARSRAELVRLALQWGLIGGESR